MMNESDIQAFWDRYPCGDLQVGGLENYRNNYEAFFTNYDEVRYTKESHILRCLDQIDLKGQHTLEIGLGQGADSEQLIRRGAIWSGVDLSDESVNRVRARLTLRDLPFKELKTGSVLSLPYEAHSFDVVFSHGVLHHVPDIEQAQGEIHRVLKPTGVLVVMLYAKWSLNYLLSISVLRRLGLSLLYVANYDPGGIVSQHLANARAIGLRKYLTMSTFIHRNTDGPQNPYSRVYGLADVGREFRKFRVVRAQKEYMHAPPLPVSWLPVKRLLGWHLWVHMVPSVE